MNVGKHLIGASLPQAFLRLPYNLGASIASSLHHLHLYSERESRDKCMSLMSLFPSFPPPLGLEGVCSVFFFLYGRDFPYINANFLRIINLFGSALMVEEHLPYTMEEIL